MDDMLIGFAMALAIGLVMVAGMWGLAALLLHKRREREAREWWANYCKRWGDPQIGETT